MDSLRFPFLQPTLHRPPDSRSTPVRTPSPFTLQSERPSPRYNPTVAPCCLQPKTQAPQLSMRYTHTKPQPHCIPPYHVHFHPATLMFSSLLGQPPSCLDLPQSLICFGEKYALSLVEIPGPLWAPRALLMLGLFLILPPTTISLGSIHQGQGQL